MKKVTEIPETPGGRLKKLRKEKHLSQAELAEAIGLMQNRTHTCSEKQIGYIERGERPLSPEYALLFSRFFEVRLEFLMCDDNFKTVEELNRHFVEKSCAVNYGLMALLDSSLTEVCLREGMEKPKLDNIPELMFLEAQIRDFSDALMWNYIKCKQYSHVWGFLDQLGEAVLGKGDNNG